MASRKLWTRDELIVAINLYCKTPFGKMHNRNPAVIKLAKLLDRTPSSIAWKLVNFASLDPSLRERGIKGAVNISKLDDEIWHEFFDNIDTLSVESEQLLHKYETTRNLTPTKKLIGKDVLRKTKSRNHQSFFRSMLLASYNSKCCITGISTPALLIASHIKPWSQDEKNRLNPQNGLLLNALHDKAFDAGIITITEDHKLKLGAQIMCSKDKNLIQFFIPFNNEKINLPSKFIPNPEFLKYHNENIFQG